MSNFWKDLEKVKKHIKKTEQENNKIWSSMKEVTSEFGHHLKTEGGKLLKPLGEKLAGFVNEVGDYWHSPFNVENKYIGLTSSKDDDNSEL